MLLVSVPLWFEISLFNKLAEEIVCRTGLQFLMTEPLSWLAAKTCSRAHSPPGDRKERGDEEEDVMPGRVKICIRQQIPANGSVPRT